ncbi:MAG: glycosyltransferase [Bacteroidetes bacterium]|nr:glycosyltransferase [Bacteroidota bacterium]
MGKPIKSIIFTVTNDLVTDQRMQRIAGTFAEAGYWVKLVGRRLPDSSSASHLGFPVKRIRCRFNKGKLFYLEYNFRLFLWLCFQRFDCLWAVDCDTAWPARFVSVLRRKPWVFDAHELFSRVPEVIHRKTIQKIWQRTEKMAFSKAALCVTVGPALAQWFRKEYGRKVEVVRNMPALKSALPYCPAEKPFVLYQGALNEGRGLENLIRAMHQVDCRLLLAGEGDLSMMLRQLVMEEGLQEKVLFLGKLAPADLPALTATAWVGYNVSEPAGLSYQLSLNNKFFDYVHAGLPSLINRFEEYVKLNNEIEVGLITDPEVNAIVANLQLLLNDKDLHLRLSQNCLKARELWNWEKEKLQLLTTFEASFVHG